MMKITSMVVVLLLFAIFVAKTTTAAVIFEHLGGNDPTTEEFGAISAGGSADPGPPASWRMTSEGALGYTSPVNTASFLDPTGWTISVTSRIFDTGDLHSAFEAGLNVEVNSTGFSVMMCDLDACGGTGSGYYTQDNTGAWFQIGTADPSTGFYAVQITMDPANPGFAGPDDVFKWYIDGVLEVTKLRSDLKTTNASDMAAPGGRLTAGSGTTDQAYALVKMETGHHVIPEPTSAIVTGIGLIGLCGLRPQRK